MCQTWPGSLRHSDLLPDVGDRRIGVIGGEDITLCSPEQQHQNICNPRSPTGFLDVFRIGDLLVMS